LERKRKLTKWTNCVWPVRHAISASTQMYAHSDGRAARGTQGDITLLRLFVLLSIANLGEPPGRLDRLAFGIDHAHGVCLVCVAPHTVLGQLRVILLGLLLLVDGCLFLPDLCLPLPSCDSRCKHRTRAVPVPCGGTHTGLVSFCPCGRTDVRFSGVVRYYLWKLSSGRPVAPSPARSLMLHRCVTSQTEAPRRAETGRSYV
jgi:hypothetical protein